MSNQFGGFNSTSPLSSIPHNPLHTLLSNIIRNNFGPTIQTVFDALLSLGARTTLPQLVHKIQSQCRRDFNEERFRLTKGRLNKMKGGQGYVIDKNVIVAALATLCHFSIVTHEKQKTGGWKYTVDVERGKLMIRFPRYVEFAKRSVDEMAGVVVEELCVNGRLKTSDVVQKSVESQVAFMSSTGDADDEDEGLDEGELEELRDGAVKSFKKLVEGGFIEQVDPIATPQEEDQEAEFEELPKKRKRNNDKETASEQKPDIDNCPPEILRHLQKHTRTLPLGCVWRVNTEMFHATIRAFCLGRLVHERYGDKVPAAGSIVTAALKYAAREEHAPVKYTLSNAEILRREENKGIFTPDDIMDFLQPSVLNAFKTKTGGARNNISMALVSLTQFSWPVAVMEVEEASGHPKGGAFEIATRQLVAHLRHRIMHQVINDQFGPVAARVCSILQTKGLLESDAIADGVMVPAKDVREILHMLFRAKYIHLMNMQQTKSHNSETAIYLWTVKPDRMFRIVTDDVCKALLNLRLRRQHEVEVGKEWIERGKQTALGDENESEVDKLNYQMFCQGLERLDNACVQLDETLMVLKDF